MQKLIIFIAFFLLFPVLSALAQYDIIEDSVYYRGEPISVGDAETFEELSAQNARDKNFCYFRSEKISSCKAKDFSSLLGDYSKDNIYVYWQSSRIEGAEANTFVALDTQYARDRLNVYFEGRVVPGARSDSFSVIESGYARDADALYKGTSEISGVDPASFEIINAEYYKDKDSIYYQGEVVEDAHPGSFRMMANDYARDANYFFRYGKAVAKSSNKYYERFQDSDLTDTCSLDSSILVSPETLEPLANGFAKDEICVYFEMELLLNSDASSFQIINEKIAKDKNFVYVLTDEGIETVPFASASSFEDLGAGYYKDKYVVYYGANLEILNGADIDSFQVVCTSDNCTYEAEDKNRYYLGGLEVGLDEATQQIIGEAKLVYSSPDNIISLTSYNGVARDLEKEIAGNGKYLQPMIIGVYDLEERSKSAILNFIIYGTQTTRVLGEGERAGVVNSYKAAFGKLPQTEQDWSDVLKISNGRWPTERNEIAEERADRRFRYIYHRGPYSFDQHDQSAITIIAYGLRNRVRNTQSEKSAIFTFRSLFMDYPSSASDWDMVRAIAYSGASR